jgi:hypothetical protein
MITYEELRANFEYHPLTGIFYRKWPAMGLKMVGGPNPRGYIHIKFGNRTYYAHRLAWLYRYGSFPDSQIDHINGIKNDNHIVNLRPVTSTGNSRNQKQYSTNTSGRTGVHWCKRENKWVSSIKVGGKSIQLGLHHVKEDAVASRKAAEKKYGFHENHENHGRTSA